MKIQHKAFGAKVSRRQEIIQKQKYQFDIALFYIAVQIFFLEWMITMVLPKGFFS